MAGRAAALAAAVEPAIPAASGFLLPVLRFCFFRSILSSISPFRSGRAHAAAGDGLRAGRGGRSRTKLHAELLHDPLRTQVRDGREGYQFFDAQLCGERYAGLRRFRRITLIPAFGPKAPAYFDFILHGP